MIKEELMGDYETIKHIIKFIEEKQIVSVMNKQEIEENEVNYSFINFNDKTISCLYLKINVS
ncbi:MAG: hypothetical protein ACOZBL_03880 [Patescibacteria group bacterium]